MEKTFLTLVLLTAIVSILFVTNVIAVQLFLWFIIPISIVLLVVGIIEIARTINLHAHTS